MTEKTVTLPLEEYNTMLEIVNRKQDINISFVIHKNEAPGYLSILVTKNVYTFAPDRNLNKKIQKQLDETINQLDEIKYQEFSSQLKKQSEMVRAIDTELLNIKSKWWYKLFN